MSPSPIDPNELEHPAPAAVGARRPKPRLRTPQPEQVEIRASLEELLEPDHPARAVWEAVCGLDLSYWLDQIQAVEGRVGRDATDPRILVAVWVYATLEGEVSARKLARLCQEHLAYRWLCGGVSVNHRLLANFRSHHPQAWNALVTQIVAALMAEGLVTLQRVAQDGMRVRAHAGKSSFRRQPRLEKCLEEARRQVETLAQLAQVALVELTRRQQAARERAARQRQQLLEDALRHCQQVQAQREATEKKSGRKAKAARASSTDLEARVMEFSNGGFASLDTIHQADQRGCTVYAPLKDEAQQQTAGKDPYAPKPKPAVKAWWARMGQAAAKAIYRLRCQAAEWVNAQCRNRGLWQMPVRGLAKCCGVAAVYALTHNLLLALNCVPRRCEPSAKRK